MIVMVAVSPVSIVMARLPDVPSPFGHVVINVPGLDWVQVQLGNLAGSVAENSHITSPDVGVASIMMAYIVTVVGKVAPSKSSAAKLSISVPRRVTDGVPVV